MLSWLRNLGARRALAEENEFFDAWDEMGWPDYVEGSPVYPTWDEVAKKWVYPHRESEATKDAD